MTLEAAKNVDEILLSLTERFPVKVWSFLVTIFGDLAEDSDFEIPGPVLSKLTEGIGIKPEAMRVALHRLRKDDWLSTRKVGRVSFYRLSLQRQLETSIASKRIFSASNTDMRKLFIAFNQPESRADNEDKSETLEIGDGIILAARKFDRSDPNQLSFETSPEDLPAWMKQKFVPKYWAEDCDDFLQFVRALNNNRTTFRDMSPSDRAMVRLLVVHNWRRMVLRLSELVEIIQSPDWVGHICRAETLELLELLPQPNLGEITNGGLEPVKVANAID